MSAMTDTALQAAPATKARGYWATVGGFDASHILELRLLDR